MYGDTAAMRRHAIRLRDVATDLRAMADRLVGQADAVSWQGRAARDMRERMADRAAHLRESAADHETGAELLEKHLAEVARLKDAIATRQDKADRLVTDARERVAAIEQENAATDTSVTREATPEDVALTQFDPPPSGHKDWLTVELPGLA